MSNVTNAEIFRMGDRIGTIEPGKLADLLVVRDDPVRDMRLLLAPEENLLLIMKGGAVKKCLLA
jgi:imidazolonepropionase-like amidohydrolase